MTVRERNLKSVTARSSGRVRVAWLHTAIPSYRVPFLQRLAERSELEVDCFHGEGREGYNVTSVGRELPTGSVWVRNIFWPFGGGRVLWQTAFWKIVRGRYDVVVCSESVHNMTVWALRLAQAWAGFRLVLIGYGYRPETFQGRLSPLRDSARMDLIRAADAILVYTERGRQTLLDEGVEPEKLFNYSNTLDTEMLMNHAANVDPGTVTSLRQRYGLEQGRTLLYVGRLAPVKQVPSLLAAVRQLNERGTACQLLVIGEGHESEALRASASDLPNVHFLGAIYDERELAHYFMTADLLVMPGRVGLTCVHGFAYGVPVVTSRHDVEQSPEFDYVDSGYNGVIVDKPEAELYAQTVEALLADKARLAQLSRGALQTAETLSMRNMVEQFSAAMTYSARVVTG